MDILLGVITVLYIIVVGFTVNTYVREVLLRKNSAIKRVKVYGIARYVGVLIFLYFILILFIGGNKEILIRNLLLIIALGMFAIVQFCIGKEILLFEDYVFYLGQRHDYNSILKIEFGNASKNDKTYVNLSTKKFHGTFKICITDKDEFLKIFLNKVPTKVKI